MPPPGNRGMLSPIVTAGVLGGRVQRETRGPRVESHYLFNITLHLPRAHTHIPGPARGPCWSCHGRMGRWLERRRPELVRLATGDVDRVPSRGPSSPECAPCVEDHRPAGVGVEGPEDPHTVVPCRGGQDRETQGRAPWHTPPAQLIWDPRLLGPPGWTNAQLSLSREGYRVDGCTHFLLLTACSLGTGAALYRCAYLRGTATGFASPCTPVYVSEHPLSCSLRVLSRVLCCLQYAPVHYAALVPLSCIPRFLFTNYHAALLLSSFPGMALSTHLSVSSSV